MMVVLPLFLIVYGYMIMVLLTASCSTKHRPVCVCVYPYIDVYVPVDVLQLLKYTPTFSQTHCTDSDINIHT